jgi:signal transduction histidine kinase
MNADTAKWSRRYQAALHRHLQQGPEASLAPALKLGRQAAALGMETLDVIRIHEEALKTLPAPDGSPGTRPKQERIDQAREFFAEATVPIEQTHAPAVENAARMEQLALELQRRTEEATETSRRLEQTVIDRRTAEAALTKSAAHRAKLVAEARRLQTQLRRMTREIQSAQERERRKTGRHLNNEVAQTLLAIHIRLLSLQAAAKNDSETLQNEIDETKRLVDVLVVKIQPLTRILEEEDS